MALRTVTGVIPQAVAKGAGEEVVSRVEEEGEACRKQALPSPGEDKPFLLYCMARDRICMHFEELLLSLCFDGKECLISAICGVSLPLPGALLVFAARLAVVAFASLCITSFPCEFT